MDGDAEISIHLSDTNALAAGPPVVVLGPNGSGKTRLSRGFYWAPTGAPVPPAEAGGYLSAPQMAQPDYINASRIFYPSINGPTTLTAAASAYEERRSQERDLYRSYGDETQPMLTAFAAEEAEAGTSFLKNIATGVQAVRSRSRTPDSTRSSTSGPRSSLVANLRSQVGS